MVLPKQSNKLLVVINNLVQSSLQHNSAGSLYYKAWCNSAWLASIVSIIIIIMYYVWFYITNLVFHRGALG